MGNFLVKSLSTFFYIGYLPGIPGTYGSLVGLLIFFLVGKSPVFYCLISFAILISGFLTCGATERLLRKKDPSCIVIDEVVGMLFSLIFLPADIKVVIIAFVIFRILDSLKPYPAGKLQNLKGSLGIMADDLIASLYTNIILQIALRLACFKAS